MDTEYIREYVWVASEGSMTKAAAQLNISQPGLSKHMVALEKCVGGELLQRSSTGVTPTPLGRAFLERAYDILRVYDGAMDYMAKMRDSKPLHLRVNALSDCTLDEKGASRECAAPPSYIPTLSCEIRRSGRC